MFPERDVRDVVRLKDRQLMDECSKSDRSWIEESVLKLERATEKYLPMQQCVLREHLNSMQIKGTSTYVHCAGCIKAAEYDLETNRMAKKDSPAIGDHFSVEDTSGDHVKRMDSNAVGECSNVQSLQVGGVKRRFDFSASSTTLDKRQKSAVVAATCKKLTLINAGPGTGKTTTLCVMVRELMNLPEKPKILFLSYSTKAEQVMKEKLVDMGLDHCMVDKRDMYIVSGICVLTFDKYAYTINKTVYESYNMSKLKVLDLLREISKQRTQLLDYIIVDECQDLSLVEFQMLEEVGKFSKRTVLAGDPRQE